MSVASIITVASCILILSFSYCIVSNLDYILKNIEEETNLTVYIADSFDEANLDALEEKLLKIEHIVGVDYTSSQEAMAWFVEKYESLDSSENNFFAGLQETNERILPSSFDIQVDSIENQDSVKRELEKLVGEELEKVSYDKESVDFLIGLNNLLRISSIIIILLLSVVSVVIIINTIKLTVNNRKSEINIMKYVGATDSFIRWPFIIEGMLIGFLGALIPVGLCFVSYGNIIAMVNENIPLLTAFMEFKSTQSVFGFLFPFAILLGISIGSIGSITSIKRHLLV